MVYFHGSFWTVMRNAPVFKETASGSSKTSKAHGGHSSFISSRPFTFANSGSGHIRRRRMWGEQTVRRISTLLPWLVVQWNRTPSLSLAWEAIFPMNSCCSDMFATSSIQEFGNTCVYNLCLVDWADLFVGRNHVFQQESPSS